MEASIEKTEASIDTLMERSHEDRETAKATERHLHGLAQTASENTGMLMGLLAAFKIKLPERATNKESE